MFFSAGIGDAVLLIPTVKYLKKQGFRVSGFFNSPHPCEEIFTESDLLDEILVYKNKTKHILFSTRRFLKYDLAIVNYFAASRKNLITAGLVSKQTVTNKKVTSASTNLFRSKTKFIKPVEDIHDAQQNLLLAGTTSPLRLSDFFIDFIPEENETLSHPFVALQISAGNNKVQYKNWPVKYWIELLKLFTLNYPDKEIVLLGDENEAGLAEEIISRVKTNVVSLIGKTTIKEAMGILARSDFFIGLDGGLMHLAVALNKPSFTLWGPSNENLYGYENFNDRLHKCMHLFLTCRSCSAWINPNHTRVQAPELCPDQACLHDLLPETVFDQLKQYVTSLSVHAG
ncbi:MAG: glycosyltransferase family 9 protein [Bacteroidia bacterium]